MSRGGWPALLALALVLAPHVLAQPTDAIEALFAWVRELGGTINAEVKINKDGYRGLFASQDIPENGTIANIPAAAIMNVGGLNDSFAVPTLMVLREIKDSHTRFAKYKAMWPAPDGLVNSCNMHEKYIKMWKSEYWERNQRDWQYHLEQLHKGALNPDIEYTIEEVVGNEPVSLDDLKYACAISSTRYVSTSRRRRLLMAPVFDLANHDRDCPHLLSPYDVSDFLTFLAGAPMKKGDEICYSYGALRDDYAVAHYGFLPRLEHPPRLMLVDHPDQDPSGYAHDAPPSEDPFTGTPEAMRAEMERLLVIYRYVKSTPDPLPPQPKGRDYTYDLMKELETRRLAALKWHINDLASQLGTKAEL